MAIPVLSIDYMVLTIPIAPEQQQEIQGRMEHALTLYQNSLESQRPQGRYRFGYLLTTQNGEAIQIESQPSRVDYNYLKLVYSPARIGPEGTALLGNYLSEILGPSYREEFYGGRLQRIEVSFELQGMLLSDLWIYRVGERDKKVALIFDADFAMNSVCVGYDSTRRLIFTQELWESAEPCVRVEYIHEKGTYTLSDFYGQIGNPLQPITIRHYMPLPDMDEINSRMLFDSCRIRGRSQVLAMYPKGEERKSMKAATMRFPAIDASKLKLAIWLQLRGEIGTLLPPIENGEAASSL
jgi:hypothetical protein